tara:strand:- start:290 stop:487 length:198 start_codon:yes stop_codon:yes gene_type:complete
MYKIVKLFFKTKKFITKVISNKKVKNIAYKSYQVYSVVRVVRNPFLILEYINMFNGLKLIGDKNL